MQSELPLNINEGTVTFNAADIADGEVSAAAKLNNAFTDGFCNAAAKKLLPPPMECPATADLPRTLWKNGEVVLSFKAIILPATTDKSFPNAK